MKQMTLAATRGFEKHNRATRKAEFLSRMEGLMPWAEFCSLIEPHYPKAGNGRPPVGLERMLRMYCVANWFNLADEACEDALYDVAVFREFCRIDLGRERECLTPRPCSTSVTCWRSTTLVPRCSPRWVSCCWPMA
jgi:IS5 family transposase